eukprot:CAMPEP_0174370786 /NCGR_PEP_ID=MMETSP0811_2-20130205/97315_1 /TAXON_ID=73025 ORGANISM="Eutreptiella gymnastica-like, Strain CCMP1594" /NCGR_SAMPLE_ID=MMETSP0811_2 /ASSEMBLY_ACC=CAM_ASM_000667 /LENGTH=59 /DNA_ID=CAMNT_0015516533 /DNA_START=99 /DNA_END=275 /DNA_ORIENTATION=+
MHRHNWGSVGIVVDPGSRLAVGGCRASGWGLGWGLSLVAVSGSWQLGVCGWWELVSVGG